MTAGSLAGRVAVVTGGGRGIGAAAAVQLAQRGATVAVVDTGAGLYGEPLHEPVASAVASSIRENGGTAVSADISVTDAEAVSGFFAELVDRFGRVDIVVNTAGILPSSGLPASTDDDWRAVLDVHVCGYVNVLAAALPLMRQGGRGRILGVTSGAGLARTAPGSAYGPAKRAVAALTWDIGRVCPSGVTVNALSPVAATRMVPRSPAPPTDGAGLDLSQLPGPETLAPAVAYLCDDRFAASSGRVLFCSGTEISLIEPPAVLEAVELPGGEPVPRYLDAIARDVLGPANERQQATGGGNARRPKFGVDARPLTGSVAVVGADPALRNRIVEAVSALGGDAVGLADDDGLPDGLAALVVVSTHGAASEPDAWPGVLDEHKAACDDVVYHARWLRHVGSDARRGPVRVVSVAVARRAGTRAGQSVAQLARGVAGTPGFDGRVAALSLTAWPSAAGELLPAPTANAAAWLALSDDAARMAGAELVAGPGWIGVQSHPGPSVSVMYQQSDVPDWVDAALRSRIAG